MPHPKNKGLILKMLPLQLVVGGAYVRYELRQCEQQWQFEQQQRVQCEWGAADLLFLPYV